MNKKIKIINRIFFIISFIIYFYLVLYKNKQYVYNMSYFKCIIYSLLVCLTVYLSGIAINKDYNKNIVIYIIWFLIILFSFTFIIGRPNLKLYNWHYEGQLTIFYTIINQLKKGSNLSILKNIFGNLFVLIPLSFLLMIKNSKYKNILKQTIIVLPIIFLIEILQAYTHTGVFDIDDIFLNYLGVLLFIILITRKNMIDKIRKIFYTDYGLKYQTKNILYYISILLYIIYILYIIIPEVL